MTVRFSPATKQLGHALATYKFYQDGELYGTLEKQFDLVRDRFTMEVTEGETGAAGVQRAPSVTTTRSRSTAILGAIMNDMDLTVETWCSTTPI